MNHDPDEPTGRASPRCFAHELDRGERDRSAPGVPSPDDLAHWRKNERVRLIERRLAVPAATRKRIAESVATHLDRLVEPAPDTVVSLYWPFRGELNLRGWMQRVFERGARVALPIVEAKARPLTFREWTPDTTLVPGVWNIPVPAEGDVLDPTVIISPLVGFDPEGYRLGYGGGFFDRTLAAMHARELRPLVIGVGHSGAAIATIHPQPHDIPMSIIVTEQGVHGKP